MDVPSMAITQTWTDAIDGWLLQMTRDGASLATPGER
jgi:hypothetical protein